MFISPGFAFTDGVQDQGSATALAAFLVSANVTSIALSDLRTTAHAVQVSATTPGSNQGAGSLWFDSTLNMLRQLDSTRWDCPYQGAEMANSTGSTIAAGSWVVASADNSVSPCHTSPWSDVLGVAEVAIANGAKGIIKRTGLVQARCLGPLSYGDALISSTAFGADGYAKGATTVYGYTAFTGAFNVGLALGTLGNTTGLITCLMWR